MIEEIMEDELTWKEVIDNDLILIMKDLFNRGLSVNRKFKDQDSLLHKAAGQGKIDVCSLLVERNCDINITNASDVTPLHLSCIKGHTSVVKLLVNSIVDDKDRAHFVNTTDKDGWSALHCASQEGHREIVSSLIEAGSDITITDASGSTPLHLSCLNGHTSIVQLLVNSIVDDKDRAQFVSTTNKGGWSALLYASREGHLELSKILIIAGCNVLVYGIHNSSALTIAALFGYLDIVQLLVDNVPVDHLSTYIDHCDNHGQSALHIAAACGHSHIVEYLLSFHADIMICDNKGQSALHAAVIKGHLSVVKVLIESIVDMKQLTEFINLADLDGHSALTYANDINHENILLYLVDIISYRNSN